MIYGAGKLGVDELASGSKNGVRAMIMQLHVNGWFTWKLHNRYVIRNRCDREAYTNYVGTLVIICSHGPKSENCLHIGSWRLTHDMWLLKFPWIMSRSEHVMLQPFKT